MKTILTTLFAVLLTTSVAAISDADPQSAFEEWVKKYKKHYASEEEKARKRDIFYQNNQFIQDHNAKLDKTFTMGNNFYSDMTHEEFLGKFGLNRDLPSRDDESDVIVNGKKIDFAVTEKDEEATKKTRKERNLIRGTRKLDDLPDSVNWKEEGVVTSVKDQKSCGSCWAFAALAAVESAKILYGDTIESDTAEQELVDCDDNLDEGCNGGWYDWAWRYMIQTDGIASEEDYPYTATNGECLLEEEGIEKMEGTQLEKYVILEPFSTKALMEGLVINPVAVAINASSMSFQFYSSGVISDDCSTSVNHALLAVGYGTTEDGEEYWYLKNSWGEFWGDSGYVKLARDSSDEGEGVKGQCGILEYPMYPVMQQ